MEVLAVSHVHSKWSYDGSWTLEALGEKFSRRGCRVLLMTEHDRGFSASRLVEYRESCARASSDKILVMPGMEYSDAANRVHVLVWGKVPFLGENLPTIEMLEGVKRAGGVAVLAHPSRKDAWKTYEESWGPQLLGIEVWNRKYDGWAPSQTAPELQLRANTVPFVGLDFHTERQSFPLMMALDLEGDEVSEEAVLSALSSRRCSPRAFDRPLNQTMGRPSLLVLQIAERARKKAASIVKSRRRNIK
jgi:hypothetical protein